MPYLDGFQCLDGMIGISLGQFPKVQSLLHTQPNLRSVTECLTQTHGHDRCHRAFLINKFRDAKTGHTDPIGKLFLSHLERGQYVFSQHSARMR